MGLPMHNPTPVSLQQSFWNGWNATTREISLNDIPMRQAEIVGGWLERLGRRDLQILEVGCGAGWLCPQLARFGKVTATDLSDQVLQRAQVRMPEVGFVAGDFMEFEFGVHAYDVIVTLEVLAHVADQPAFVRKLASHLRPGGHLMLATQNRYVLQKYNRIPPPAPGQLRRWVDQQELRDLLTPYFDVQELFSVTPKADHGLMWVVNARKLNVPVRALFGLSVDRFKERLGLGWTLMTLARSKQPV